MGVLRLPAKMRRRISGRDREGSSECKVKYRGTPAGLLVLSAFSAHFSWRPSSAATKYPYRGHQSSSTNDRHGANDRSFSIFCLVRVGYSLEARILVVVAGLAIDPKVLFIDRKQPIGKKVADGKVMQLGVDHCARQFTRCL
jgi:hypothetical protein